MDFARALSLHQAGRTREAEAAYRALLAVEPGNAAVLHALGVLRHQAGDSAGALPFLHQAVQAQPGAAEPLFNLGLALLRLGQPAQAAEAFGAAARLRPGWHQPPYDLGNALQALGRFEEAARAYRAALKLRPDFAQAEANLGNALRAAGKTEQAIAAYRRLLRRRPDMAEVHHNLGVALLSQNDVPGAEACFRAALSLRADFAEALESLARLLVAAGRFAEAAGPAMAACAARPDRPDLAELLGDARRGAGQHARALEAYARAIALDPGRHSARFAMAETHRLQRDPAGAEAVLRGLVGDLPDSWLAHHDLGNVLRDQGRFAAAEDAYRAALSLSETPIALNHLAAVLREQGRLEEAQVTAERGLALAPGNQDLQYNLAITHLAAGRLREGFALYDVRFAKYGVKPLPGRAWTGQTLRGRTLLVAAEQGLGDTLQFVRYLPALADAGGRVMLRVPPALVRLLAGLPGLAAVLADTDPLPPYDFHVALLSLPDRLGLATPCPVPFPYLSAAPASIEAWRGRVDALPGRRVGLVWAGNPDFMADHRRSLPPAALAPLGAVPGISFVSLQKNAVALPPFGLADWSAELSDMAQTAGLVACLDLVISVDTAVAHLAGALGKPVWLINRFDTCWRWDTRSDRSAWYPGLRQFRQTEPGDWRLPIAQLAAALLDISPS
jgi:tetratricopeptide (TPR) repeat protein